MNISPGLEDKAQLIPGFLVIQREFQLVGHIILESIDDSSVGGEVNGHREPLLSRLDGAHDTIFASVLVRSKMSR